MRTEHPTPPSTDSTTNRRHPPAAHLPHTPGAPHIPHTPATHITITPKHVYINGEPISVMKSTIELSNPSPVEVQTVTLTIFPTSVTILNDDDPDTINAAREAVTRTVRDEAGDYHLVSIANTIDMINTWKRQETMRAKHTRTPH